MVTSNQWEFVLVDIYVWAIERKLSFYDKRERWKETGTGGLALVKPN